jgi:hypothetical protein
MKGILTMLNQSDLNQFHGDLERWRHSLCRNLLYTPGIKYLCEHGGEGDDNSAWWLLDAIASYQGFHVNNYEALRSMQFWTLKVEGSKATLTCDDGNSNEPVIQQRIDFTDFCLPEIRIYVADNGDGTRTAYLPSEH